MPPLGATATPWSAPSPPARAGRITARPDPHMVATVAPQSPGFHAVGLAPGRDGLLYIPKGYNAAQPAPFLIMMHGAGGNAKGGLQVLHNLADSRGVIVFSPESRGSTWDVIRGGFGPDVEYINAALDQVFSKYAVDTTRLGVGGFSDGASYALSLGLTNGDLFTHIIAFSPGFSRPGDLTGSPKVYVSHGVHDQALGIDFCSRRLVPRLKGAGYDVQYTEFNGPHTVPREIAAEGLSFFLDNKSP